jgi:hypothetical protein
MKKHQPTVLGYTSIQERDGPMIGRVTGGTRRCQLEGCTGLRIGVRWKDRKFTMPCSRGIERVSGTLGRII